MSQQNDDSNIVVVGDDHTEEQQPAAKVLEVKTSVVEKPQVVAPPPTEQAQPEVVVAPAVHGRSTVLRAFWHSQGRTGQMLVFAARYMRDAVIEVLETLLPVPRAGATTGKDSRRFFRGDRKPPEGYWPLIMELRFVNQGGQKVREYQMLYPSGKVLRSWQKLDLGVMKLKTTAEQREEMSKFLDLIYTIQEHSKPKQTHHPERHHKPGPRKHGGMGDMFSRAGVSAGQVKAKVKHPVKQHAQVRSDLQRRLPEGPGSGSAPSTGSDNQPAAGVESTPTPPGA